MADPVAHSVVHGFYAAYLSRDPERIADFLDEEVRWSISGPVELLNYCGLHCGKAAVVTLFTRIIPGVFEFKGFDPEEILIDGDGAAVFGRITGRRPGSKRPISFRVAQFTRFRDAKVVSFRAIIDSFDAVEQTLGYPLGVAQTPERAAGPDHAGNVVAI